MSSAIFLIYIMVNVVVMVNIVVVGSAPAASISNGLETAHLSFDG